LPQALCGAVSHLSTCTPVRHTPVDPTDARKDAGHAYAVGGTELEVDKHGRSTDAERHGAWKVFKMIDDPNFNFDRVSLIRVKDLRVRAALVMHQRYPQRIPIFRWRERFGKQEVQGLYLYPQPVQAVSP
jgi:hypothetical protein